MNSTFVRALMLGATMVWHGEAVIAASSNPNENVLTISQAMQLAGDHNPDLQAASYGLRGFDGRRQQADLAPPQELSFEVENAFGTGGIQGLDGAETTLALSHVIEYGDKRQRRVGVIDAAEALQRSRYEELRVEVAADVLERFIDAASAQEQLELATREVALADQTLAAVAARVDAAVAPTAELHRARADQQRAQMALRLAEAAHKRAMDWLAASWGAPQSEHTRVEAQLMSLPTLAAEEMLREQLDRSPLARRLRDEVAFGEAELQLAESQSARDLELSGGVRYLSESDDAGIVFSVSVPLGTARRNAGGISTARASFDEASALSNAELRRANALLERYLSELGATRMQFEALRDGVLPELDAALDGTRSAYEQGRYGYLELADAQGRLIRTQAEMIDAATRYHELLASIERLTGQALVQPSQTSGETK